jgi:hypothetical protein
MNKLIDILAWVAVLAYCAASTFVLCTTTLY